MSAAAGSIRRPAATALLLCCALAPAACRSPRAPTRLRIAHESDVLSLDPTAVQENTTHSILSNVYEPLVSFDRDMSLVPALATDWNAVDDRTWLFQLRKGVRFHDGTPLSAEDVRDSLERARNDPASGIRGQLSTVEAVEVVDRHTLRLRTLRPDPIMVVRLTYVLVARGFDPNGRSSRPLGTGPYKIVRWDRGRALEVEAFGEHWHGRPSIDRVSFVPVEEGRASVEALRQGGVDVLRWVPETMAGEVQALPGVKLLARAGLLSYYLWFHAVPAKGMGNPFADRRVRRAVSMAIDREAIIRGLGGHGLAATQLVQKGVFGYVAALEPLPYDPEAARRLLKQAGHPEGFDATLVHRSQATVSSVARMLKEMLGQVGIRLRLETPDWSVVVARWTEGRLPFFLAGWRFESGDAASFLRDCLYTRDPAHNTGSYNPGFSSPELDRLIDENDQIFGEANRLKHYEKVMRLVSDEIPIVPLYHKQNLYGVSDKLRWTPRLDGKLLAAEMSFESERR